MIPKKSNPKNTLTLTEAAARIGVTAGRLRQLIRSGELRAHKIDVPLWRVGYYYRISEAEVARFIRLGRTSVGRPRIGDRDGTKPNGQHPPDTRKKN